MHCESKLVLHMFRSLSSPSRHTRSRQYLYASIFDIVWGVFC